MGKRLRPKKMQVGGLVAAQKREKARRAAARKAAADKKAGVKKDTSFKGFPAAKFVPAAKGVGDVVAAQIAALEKRGFKITPANRRRGGLGVTAKPGSKTDAGVEIDPKTGRRKKPQKKQSGGMVKKHKRKSR